MNNRAYTIIELLAVIVIIGLMFTIAIVSYSYLINKANDRVYESYCDSMHEAAQNYIIKNDFLLKNGNSTNISLDTLLSEGWLEKINNPKDNNDDCKNGSYVKITRNDIDNVVRYEYEVRLNCNDYTNNRQYS